jgi:hypothetical protein
MVQAHNAHFFAPTRRKDFLLLPPGSQGIEVRRDKLTKNRRKIFCGFFIGFSI